MYMRDILSNEEIDVLLGSLMGDDYMPSSDKPFAIQVLEKEQKSLTNRKEKLIKELQEITTKLASVENALNKIDEVAAEGPEEKETL